MKQGRAPMVSTGTKQEPIPYARSPGAVSYYGNMKGAHVDGRDLNGNGYPNDTLGNGFSPNKPVASFSQTGPGAGRTVRPKGSQGKY